jgi:hypothetical protein
MTYRPRYTRPLPAVRSLSYPQGAVPAEYDAQSTTPRNNGAHTFGDPPHPVDPAASYASRSLLPSVAVTKTLPASTNGDDEDPGADHSGWHTTGEPWQPFTPAASYTRSTSAALGVDEGTPTWYSRLPAIADEPSVAAVQRSCNPATLPVPMVDSAVFDPVRPGPNP